MIFRRRSFRSSVMAPLFAALTLMTSGCAAGLGSLPLPALQVATKTMTLTAIFSNALNLPKSAKVKLNGANIGEVTSVRAHDFNAYVDMRVDSGVQLYRGATAQLRSATPLGDIFVAISPDAHHAPDAPRLRDGDTIPLESTTAAATIEEVLSSATLLVNGGSIRQLVTILNGAGNAAGGQGQDIATLLQRSSDIVSRLNKRSRQIENTLQSTTQLSATLNARRETINTAIAAATPATSVIADNASQLADLADTAGRISTQLSKFPSLQGTDTGSIVADLNRLDDALTQVAVDPNITLTKTTPLLPVVVKITGATSVPGGNANIVRLALGNHPDKNFPGDPAFHGPDGTDWHLMVGSLRYEWNLLLDKVYGANR